MLVDPIFDEDYLRLKEFMQLRFPDQAYVPDDEYEKAYEEYSDLYPMDLVVLETDNELLFYNRPVGLIQRYKKIPRTSFFWEEGKLLKWILITIQVKIKMTWAKINKNYKPKF